MDDFLDIEDPQADWEPELVPLTPEEIQQIKREIIEDTKSRTPRWQNALGEDVDLDNIDRKYALNIYSMVLRRRAQMGYTTQDVKEDNLLHKLYGIILDGRKPNLRDKLRAEHYNFHTKRAGLPFRAKGF